MLNPNNKIILTMTSERKLTAIETDDMRVKLNGLSNSDYKTMLGAAGVELRFEEGAAPAVESELRTAVLENLER